MRAQEFVTENWGVEKYPIPLPIGDYLADGSDEFAPPGNYRSAEDLHNEVYDLIDAGVEPQVANIDPRTVLATQDWLSNAGGDDPLFDEYPDRPVIYSKSGKLYILDGHHRTTRAWRAGRPISVYLFSDNRGLQEETGNEILRYVKSIHPRGEFTIDQVITNHPEWELTNVPLHQLHIADQEENSVSPYSQILFIDYDHVNDITVQDIKQYPIVIDPDGWIIDGNHRAVAAKQMGLKSIPAWRPAAGEWEEETYDQFVARRRAEKGLKESASTYREIEFVCANPDFCDATDPEQQRQLYQQLQKIPGVIPVYQDQSDYSAGQFSLSAIYNTAEQRRQIMAAARALGVAVDLVQPVDDDYVDRAVRGELEGQIQENRSFNRCYDRACQLYDRAEAKGIDATLLQVADYQGDGSTADARWQRLPQYVWKHYVTVIGDTVFDPTAEQFGPGRPKKYSLDELKSQWKEIYTIRSTAVNEDIYDVLQPLNCGPFDGGCVLVAQALQQIHGGRVVVLVDADDRAQHAAVLADGKLIDYDGAADPKEFVQQFEQNERANIQGIRPIRDTDLPDAPRDANLIPQIVQALSENFADGKIKGKSRPGRVRRAGASCDGSVTDLRARAKKYSGERAKMYHWCANMKSGKKK